jgi:hypothetical protein
MADFTACAAFFLVITMLALSIWRQFEVLESRGQVLDSIAILPQWKFFAQNAIASSDEMFDDFHLLIRLVDSCGNAGPWQEIFWTDEREWHEMFWSPDLRPNGEIIRRMWQVSSNRFNARELQFQTSLAYLTLLRHCLDCAKLAPDQAIQFSIVATAGRGDRPLAVRFVSAWHIP